MKISRQNMDEKYFSSVHSNGLIYYLNYKYIYRIEKTRQPVLQPKGPRKYAKVVMK